MLRFHRKYRGTKYIMLVVIMYTLILVSNYALASNGMDSFSNVVIYLQDSERLVQFMVDANVKIERMVFQHSQMVAFRQTERDAIGTRQLLEKQFGVTMEQVSGVDHQDVLRYQGEGLLGDGSKLQLALIAKRETKPSKGETFTTHLVAQVITTNTISWKQDISRLVSGLNEAGIRPIINTSVQGTFEGALKASEQNEFIRKMFTQAKGEVLEGLTIDSVTSLSGYTPLLNRTITSGENELNVQIATTVNEAEEVTEVTIGNPVIVVEY